MSDVLRRHGSKVWWIALWIVLVLAPLQLAQFWEQTGLFAMAAIIGAIGLTILTGVTGQLSLAHAFFLAVGAYGYCYFAGHKGLGVEAAAGLGLPPLLALILAVLLAGAVGALSSPLSGRLRGVYGPAPGLAGGVPDGPVGFTTSGAVGRLGGAPAFVQAPALE